MMAFGLRRAGKVYRWLKSRYYPGVIILGYHRISDNSADSYNITVSTQHFNEQMEILKTHTDIINMTDLQQRMNQKKMPGKIVAITIDDGYADIFSNVLPILQRYNIPVTVFIAAGYLGKEFWWDKLNRIFANPDLIPDDLYYSIADRTISFNFHKHRRYLENSRLFVNSIYNVLRYLPYGEIEKILKSFTSQIKIDERRNDDRCMSGAELVELGKSNNIEIGSHSVSHPFLAHLSAGEQRYEIEQSKTALENIIKKSVHCFSYPNGSFSDITRGLVQKAGYRLAFSSEENMVLSTSDPMKLPRFWIPDWTGDKFFKWLKMWLK